MCSHRAAVAMTCEEKPVYGRPNDGLFPFSFFFFFFASPKVQLRWHSVGSVNLAVRSSPSSVKMAPRMGVTGVVIES